MKKQLLLALLFLPLLGVAQDWKSVRLADTTYYTIPARDGYLRTIWIDSAKAIGTDSVFYFYPSIRLGNTTTLCLDTLGPTWLGKQFIKEQDGDEVFFNRWLDSIYLKPRAALNTTWLLHTDSTGRQYQATISALDTLTIDNQLDSVKTITITVLNNNLPDSSHHHFGKKLLLSKAHGFIECLEWYAFPYPGTAVGSPQGEIYPVEDRLHTRLAQRYTQQMVTAPDLALKYQVGNYWQHRYQHKMGPGAPFYVAFIYYVQDSIIQVHQINTDSVDVSFQRRNHTIWTRNQFPDSITRSVDTFRNTYYASVPDPLQGFYPELSDLDQSAGNYVSTNYFIPEIVCDRIVSRQSSYPFAVMDIGQTGCYKQTFPISNTYAIHTAAWSGFGEITKNSEAFGQPIQADLYPYLQTMVYAKLGACSYGSPIAFSVLSVSNVLDPALVKVFPNPAQDRLYFSAPKSNPIQEVQLFSLQGRSLLSCKNCTALDVQSLSNGFYILHIQTRLGSVQKKVLINH